MNRTTVNGGSPEARKGRRNGQPAWDVALLFPEQGNWSVEEYLALPGNRLVEYSAGRLEVLPVPTTLHQWIVLYLYRNLHAFVGRTWGLVLVAPLRVQLWPGKFREPDVVFMLAKHRGRVGEDFWDGADLVMEVLSDDPKDRRRDLVTKRREYAEAGIAEYWIIDPKRKQITILGLKGKKYVSRGSYGPGREARSHLLRGFWVDVAAAFSGP
jgi:Uma2 family endonuclease